MSQSEARAALVIILISYLVIGTLFAALTPAWQVPDEPAHYNYVRQLSAGIWPVLEIGDYDQGYLEELKAEGFPAGRPVDSIQYEDHQPPLYYLLQVPVFLLFDGTLLPLRLLSVVLGGLLVLLAHRTAAVTFPGRPVVALGAAAVVAFVPQHLALMAGVNNDSLSELLLAGCLLGAICILRSDRPRWPWLLGLLLGAAFCTKVQAYVAAPVLVLAILIRWRQGNEGPAWLLRWLAGILGLALLIGGVWWARNMAMYGGLDWMGLGRHDVVVTGQPTTAAWIAQHGMAATAQRFCQFTYQSFWGMFGWMGVPMQPRIYQALGAVSAATAAGWILTLRSPRRWRADRWLLALSAVLTAGGYLWYNLTYVQHQGRYLFPALVPLGLAVGVAWEKLLAGRAGRKVAALLALVAVALIGLGFQFAAVFSLGLGALLWVNGLPLFSRRWSRYLPAVLAAGLAAFSLYALLFYVVPYLQ